MSNFRPILANDSKTNFDELEWVIKIRESLDKELDDDIEFIVSIFNVPKPLLASDPDSYTPQQIAIGPYHFWRQELYEMEIYKIASTKRFQSQLQSLKLEHIVDQLIRLEHKIRSCYHKYLNFNVETLMWMMVVDASFLLEFLQIYTIQDETMILSFSSRMSHLFDYGGRKLGHNAILKDIVMLENQIPLFILRKMLEFKFTSLELADDMLILMFIGLYKEISPFKVMEHDYSDIVVSECAHLLDFLYNMIVPKLDEQSDLVVELENQHNDNVDDEKSYMKYVKKFLCEVCRLFSKLKTILISLFKKLKQCRAIKVFTWLPWAIISNLPGMGIIKQPVEYFLFSKEKETTKAENDITNNSLLIDEIAIPSVLELSKSGVSFVATKGDISTIWFDVKTTTLYLPTIGLDINTEVFMRNLVAYEASTSSGPLVFARYTELMNGIIDTEEDARILREKGVILNHLKSDQEVANLWNGMNKSIKLTRVPFLDKVIEDVNQHYNGNVSIKVWKFMKVYVFSSWQFLTFLAVVFLLFLMSLQVFCSFYRCNARNHVKVIR
ncbi:hypothetical protein MtrunA17_Chr7g0220521 [Medicago truncatula]|uniref:UPF0481 plant-like protein n=1 Tax=Medicago truncatula TaxID=3880 RepID=G7KS17_MEDTR|nr:putative UPF0481 protein At3g02645 [Medicago truncatula]AES77821.1 UPF0481 plant-like protein [Medicago truncatula]RHN44542.1 hypothetical protein MtrunA17_Chr7g0220521 [Medicago truncatula]